MLPCSLPFSYLPMHNCCPVQGRSSSFMYKASGFSTWLNDVCYRVIRPHAVCMAPIASLLKFLPSLCSTFEDHAMAQVDSCWYFTAEAQGWYYASLCGICGEQNGTGTGFFSAYICVYFQCHSTSPPHSQRVVMFGILTFCDHQCHCFVLSWLVMMNQCEWWEHTVTSQ
jgi:hypothetical protein